MGLFEEIKKTLDMRFIKTVEMAEIIALGLEGKKNVLLWGPGGHGKSEMVQAALGAVCNFEDDVFLKPLGPGTVCAELFGGIDLHKMEKTGRVDGTLCPEHSFLTKDYAVFEEFADAPSSVIEFLKDVMSRRMLVNGNQRFPMATKSVFALTNKDPRELAEVYGPSFEALLQRFPLQLKVAWSSYEAPDYLELLEKCEKNGTSPAMGEYRTVLAEVCASVATGSTCSPRQALDAMANVKTMAALRSHNRVEPEDMLALRFSPGFGRVTTTLQENLQAMSERVTAESLVKGGEEIFKRHLESIDGVKSPIKCLQMSKKFSVLLDEVSQYRVPDELYKRREALQEQCRKEAANMQKLAMDNTTL